MKRGVLFSTAAAWLLAVTAVTAQTWTVDEIMKAKSIGSVQVSPDGRRIAYTVMEAMMRDERSENVTQIWLADADGSDGYQFTTHDKTSANPRWSPDGKYLAFSSTRSGKDNIWLIRSGGGEAEQLTDAKAGVGDFEWSPDGKWIVYIAKDAPTEAEEKMQKEKNDARVVDDFKMNHAWVVPVARDDKGKREPRQVTRGDFDVRDVDWSPDGRNLAIVHAVSPTVDAWMTSDISLVEIATGQRKPLAATGAAETSPLHSPDGAWIAFTATTNPPTWARDVTVYVVPATGGTPRALALTPDNQAALVGWSADGKWIYYAETRGTVGRLSALPVDGGPSRDLSTGDGVMGAVNLNRPRTAIGFSWQTSEKAAEAFVSALDRWQPVQISRQNDALARLPMGRTELVRWKAKDGVEIEGLLTYPVGYRAGKRVPLLLVIHGGPAGVFVRSFLGSRGSYPLAVFAANGYSILRCNVRGSGGYGAKFRHANYKDWGGMDYQDLMLGVDHAISLGVADPDRLGVMGWSYGGFMTSWVITQTRRFKAASIGAPVTNLMSFTGTTDIPSFIPDYMGAEFWDDLEVYRKHSAMFNIKGVTTPSLIQHGEQDERVHYTQGMELYNALKRQGVPVKMIAYPRQPHGVSEPRLQRDVMQRNLDWFAQYVKPQPETGDGLPLPRRSRLQPDIPRLGVR